MNYGEKKVEFDALREFIGIIDMGGNASDRVRKIVYEELTPRQSEMLNLYYTQELNMPQIAEKLGVSASTVSRTIMRGKRRIRKFLQYNGRAFSQSIFD